MFYVRFISRRPGLRKVSLDILLKDQTSLTLPQAKAAVDALLEGYSFQVEMPDRESAEELLRAATELGVVGELADPQ